MGLLNVVNGLILFTLWTYVFPMMACLMGKIIPLWDKYSKIGIWKCWLWAYIIYIMNLRFFLRWPVLWEKQFHYGLNNLKLGFWSIDYGLILFTLWTYVFPITSYLFYIMKLFFFHNGLSYGLLNYPYFKCP